MDSVRPFVVSHAAADGMDLKRLTAGDVTAFLTGQARRLAPKTVQRLATALRSLLRFWHVEGLISGPLDRAVPKVANRRPGLPRPLEPAQVQALLASCDLATAGGRRDLAMMTLLARLGLRAGEVAGLRLDDIDWRRGEITIAGKGNRRDRLPLPADAGAAVADWLIQGRPSTALDRSVFIRVKAPHQGLTTCGVTMAVFAAGQRAGLGAIYAHRLRHSAATASFAEGGALAEIGQLVGDGEVHRVGAAGRCGATGAGADRVTDGSGESHGVTVARRRDLPGRQQGSTGRRVRDGVSGRPRPAACSDDAVRRPGPMRPPAGRAQ